MSQFFAFVQEGGGLRPEDRIWVWLLLALFVIGLSCLPLLNRLPRKWWRRRRRL